VNNDQSNHRFDLDLRRLEKRLEELVVICRQLHKRTPRCDIAKIR